MRARQLTLFDFYPFAPGAAERDTSAEAAAETRPRAQQLRDRVLRAIRGAAVSDGLTADEAAALLGLTAFTVRPRVTELNQLGLIEDSGRRRRNASGRRAIVWVAR